MGKPQIQLMCDSGAYSSFTCNKPVSLENYIDFCLKNTEYIKHIISLDCINPKDPEAAAAAGRENYLKMREKGLDILPVFHARERVHWLDLMLADTKYIGLSGTSLVSPRENREWHRLIWSYISDNNGFPIADFHAFGDTAISSLLSYPWTSSDSSTWMVMGGRAARIKLNGTSFQIRSQKLKDSNYILKTDSGPKKESNDAAIRALGLDPDILLSIEGTPSQIAMLRTYLVASDLLQLQAKSISCTRFKTPSSLLSIKKQLTGGTERLDPVKCYFVISPSAVMMNFPVIAALSIKRILVSYFYVATAPPNFWNEMLVPFLYDPLGYIQSVPKLKENWEFLQKVLLAPVPI